MKLHLIIALLITVSTVSAAVGFEPQGPSIGPDDHELEIVAFVSPGDRFVQRWYEYTYPNLRAQYPETRFVFTFFPLRDAGEHASRALLCADEQDAFELYLMNLLDDVEAWNGADDPSEVFVDIAERLDLETSVFRSCTDSSSVEETLESHEELRARLGVSGVPTFFVGRDGTYTKLVGSQPLIVFSATIENLTQEPAAPIEPAPEEPETDEDHYLFTAQGPTFRSGRAEAELIIFASPNERFSERWYQQTYPVLLDQENLRMIWQLVPFIGDEHTETVSLGALCAHEQNGFSGYLTAVIDATAWKDIEDIRSYVINVAASEGYDTTEFERCIDDPATRNELDSNTALFQGLGLNGRPTFFIGPADGPYVRILGAQRNEVFLDAIDRAISYPESFRSNTPIEPERVRAVAQEPAQNDVSRGRSCIEGDVTRYTCDTGELVEWCTCEGGEYSCIDNPKSRCPTVEENRSCDGCFVDGRCIELGVRFEDTFCGSNGIQAQFENGASCINNHECTSNTCSDGICDAVRSDGGIIERIVGFLGRLFN